MSCSDFPRPPRSNTVPSSPDRPPFRKRGEGGRRGFQTRQAAAAGFGQQKQHRDHDARSDRAEDRDRGAERQDLVQEPEHGREEAGFHSVTIGDRKRLPCPINAPASRRLTHAGVGPHRCLCGTTSLFV